MAESLNSEFGAPTTWRSLCLKDRSVKRGVNPLHFNINCRGFIKGLGTRQIDQLWGWFCPPGLTIRREVYLIKKFTDSKSFARLWKPVALLLKTWMKPLQSLAVLSPHCSLCISHGTYKENLLNNQEFLDFSMISLTLSLPFDVWFRGDTVGRDQMRLTLRR